MGARGCSAASLEWQLVLLSCLKLVCRWPRAHSADMQILQVDCGAVFDTAVHLRPRLRPGHNTGNNIHGTPGPKALWRCNDVRFPSCPVGSLRHCAPAHSNTLLARARPSPLLAGMRTGCRDVHAPGVQRRHHRIRANWHWEDVRLALGGASLHHRPARRAPLRAFSLGAHERPETNFS